MSGRLGRMELAFALGISAGVILPVVVGVYELLRQKRRKRAGAPLSATYINEVTAMFYGTKRIELNYRDSWSMMREDDTAGAPPRIGVDLDRRTVVLPPDDSSSGPAVSPMMSLREIGTGSPAIRLAVSDQFRDITRGRLPFRADRHLKFHERRDNLA